MLVRDLMGNKLEGYKSRIMNFIVELEGYLADVEDKYFNPEDAPSEVATIWNEGTDAIWQELEELEIYSMVPGFLEFMETAEEELEKLRGRFWRWAKRKVIDTKEAADHINRSRSSVYYWIKTGKLTAKKVKGRWQIIQQ